MKLAASVKEESRLTTHTPSCPPSVDSCDFLSTTYTLCCVGLGLHWNAHRWYCLASKENCSNPTILLWSSVQDLTGSCSRLPPQTNGSTVNCIPCSTEMIHVWAPLAFSLVKACTAHASEHVSWTFQTTAEDFGLWYAETKKQTNKQKKRFGWRKKKQQQIYQALLYDVASPLPSRAAESCRDFPIWLRLSARFSHEVVPARVDESLNLKAWINYNW